MISIVTISFNQNMYLGECLASVRTEQKLTEVEHICVDPGSTDGSVETLQRWRPDKLIIEPDDGPAAGLNKGFSHTKGEVLGFLNADDRLIESSLSYVDNFFATHPEIDVLLGSGFIIDEAGKRVKPVRASRFTARDLAFQAVTLLQQGMFFRRGAFERVGGFNELNRTCWDGELALDMCLSGARMANDRTALGEFRVYPESITGSGRLIELNRPNRQRMFVKAVGRERRRRDALEYVLRRMLKIVRERDRFLPLR